MGNSIAGIVDLERVKACEFSAEFWAENIGLYANRIRKRGERFAIASTALSTISGLGVWATLNASTNWLAIFVVSIFAIASAVISMVPQIVGFGKCAESAASLAPRYGHVLGNLKAAVVMLQNNAEGAQPFATQVIKEFEEIKHIKDNLNPFPEALAKEINAKRQQQRQQQ